MARYSVSQQERTFIRGKSIDESLLGSIIDIVAEGGDPASGYFEGSTKKLPTGEPYIHTHMNLTCRCCVAEGKSPPTKLWAPEHYYIYITSYAG